MFRLGKKTIALVMAATVALSGFMFPSVKTAKAAEGGEATVKVLGANLKLKNNKVGYQSLRVAIQVDNASQASHCGIKLKIKDSSKDYVTVSTENGYEKIYSKDAAGTVVYTAVIDNIPMSYKKTDFEIVGYVKDLANINTTTTDPEYRSIQGVVDELKNMDPAIDISQQGALIKEYCRMELAEPHEASYGGDIVISETNKSWHDHFGPHGTDTNVVYNSENGYLEVTQSANDNGIIYWSPWTEGKQYVFRAVVQSDVDMTIKTDGGQVALWNTITDMGNGWKEVEVSYKVNGYNGFILTTNSEVHNYKVKSFEIYSVLSDDDIPDVTAPPTGWNADHTEYSIKLDDASIWTNSNVTYSINQDGSVNFKVSEEKEGEFGFRIPENVYKTNRFTEAVIVYANNKIACGNHAIKYGTNEPGWGQNASSDDARYQGILNTGSGEVSIKPNHDVEFNKEYNNNFSAFRFFSVPKTNEITIKSITLKGLVQLESPTETPESYAIEGEALKNSYKGENGGPSSAEYDNTNNVMNFSFTGYTGVIYTIPDNTIDTSVYKYAQVTYTSSGGSLDAYACQADDTYPADAAASLTASDTEKVVTVSGFGKGAIKLFHWGYHADTNIAIKSIKFYQNNPETVSEDENGIVMNLPSNYNASQSGKNYGTFVNDKYYSTYTKTERPFNVILPYGYSESKKYPVIYMLHGIFGDQNAFGSSAETCSIVKTSGNLCSDGDAKEAIIVIPSIRVCTDSSIEDSFSADNYKFYDLFREDLIDNLMPYMEANYSIATGRENTAIAGFSMGGRESLYIGISKPEYFGYIGAFCPTYGIFKYEPNWTGVGEDGLFADTASFTLPAQYMNNTYTMIVKGTNDTTVHEMPTTYHNALTSNGVPHVYYEVEGGGHDEATWGHGMYNFLRKVFK